MEQARRRVLELMVCSGAKFVWDNFTDPITSRKLAGELLFALSPAKVRFVFFTTVFFTTEYGTTGQKHLRAKQL